ncbi:class I SAM-dependent methyltransferase [Halorhodospira halophila]|uniref:Methyltransferase type 12 n=1 Tax=Halorhodospira halophila (strain DSM 244 / SL1) TaxID=349124 RepID=A1WVZ6_HALHL|nr:class I SAM-dependent methyltransferase [Halorhodospira halophila]ABM61858.1 Methyltransferase type 12 [Halorhodospira halophila SL1]MBK1729844.1 class I SAM-dependent methyltransferase [Halorhodospira halophila]
MRPCPLCTDAARLFHRAERDYYRCPSCALVHVPPDQHLSTPDEKAVYDQHQNAVDDPGYRRFLARVADPLMATVPPPAQLLDFGCGHGPALAAMFREAGYRTAVYDPFYYPDPAPLRERYELVTATEVVEHLAEPAAELDGLWGCLRPGGWLGIMTKRQPPAEAFPTWHYLRDPTHVAFYAEATFHWLARRWGAQLYLPRSDVALLHRPAGAASP